MVLLLIIGGVPPVGDFVWRGGYWSLSRWSEPRRSPCSRDPSDLQSPVRTRRYRRGRRLASTCLFRATLSAVLLLRLVLPRRLPFQAGEGVAPAGPGRTSSEWSIAGVCVSLTLLFPDTLTRPAARSSGQSGRRSASRPSRRSGLARPARPPLDRRARRPALGPGADRGSADLPALGPRQGIPERAGRAGHPPAAAARRARLARLLRYPARQVRDLHRRSKRRR